MRYGLRLNNCDDAVTWNKHHLHPAKFIIDAVRIHFGKFYVISHDIANFMEWLFIFAPCVDLPDTVLVESLTPGWRAGFGCWVNAHAETPHVRKVSIPSSVKRAFVQTGSQTISISTCSTPGSCNRRARISSMMNSMAGQPMAVKVSLRSTVLSCCARSTIIPMSTTLTGSSGSMTS